jgi:putative thioredoxin
MTTQVSRSVVDVTVATFSSEVAERSKSVPVLVDFWAPWCGPCRMLGPVLERLVEEARGSWILAKVDTDQNPELGARFGVRGIPHVALFRDGEIVDRFAGALPESQIRTFLRLHIPSAADAEVQSGRDLLAAGDRAKARQAFTRALELEDHGAAHLELAKLALADGDVVSAREHAESVPIGADDLELARSLIESIELVERAKAVGDLEECHLRVEHSGDDVEAVFACGGWALAAGDYHAALDYFLRAAELDRDWEGEAPRRAMLAVFRLVGLRDPLSDEYRDKLGRLYY